MKVFEKTKMSIKSRGIPADSYSKSHVSRNWILLLCLASFCAGMFFSSRTWLVPGTKHIVWTTDLKNEGKHLVTQPCDQIIKLVTSESKDIPGEHTVKNESGVVDSRSTIIQRAEPRKRYLMVIGINTAFSSQKRRDSLRQTWVPNAADTKKLEEKRGIIVRFVIGHSSTRNGFLDKTIEEEEKKHGDFLKLDHIEGYHELSAKTKIYFSTAVAMWDADFYVKVDDDVHVNIGTLSKILLSHHNKPRVYIGCMKSGPVHYEKTRRYHEPEFWKFGDEGNNYFRHATGQIYAISNDLAHYISSNQQLLHKFANEDVSLGAWFIGLEVQHVDDRRLCCGSRQECQFKAMMDTPCAASFDWKCSGICKSVERIGGIHQRCGEEKSVLWSKDY